MAAGADPRRSLGEDGFPATTRVETSATPTLTVGQTTSADRQTTCDEDAHGVVRVVHVHGTRWEATLANYTRVFSFVHGKTRIPHQGSVGRVRVEAAYCVQTPANACAREIHDVIHFLIIIDGT